MSYKNKPGTGIAWKNDNYEKGGRFPYASGKILDLDGREIKITLWVPKTDKIKGFNVVLSEIEEREERGINDKGDLPF